MNLGKITTWIRRRVRGDNGSVECLGIRDVVISAEQASNAVFCFTGEFGYEIIAWIPYLVFLKQKLGIRISTISRPGSKVFYYFSDDHQEVSSREIGDCWGDPAVYESIRRRTGRELFICPGREVVNERRICIDGFEWTTKNIHASISQVNYLCPRYNSILDSLPFRFKTPYVVINNKYYKQWGYDAPVNYLSVADLRVLCDLFRKKGYAVVYNHFVEADVGAPNLRGTLLGDEGVFEGIEDTFDMRLAYKVANGAEERNRLQISLYNRAALVVGPQGGNLYLPAVCRRNLTMLMRVGDYIDYVELGRVYGVSVDAFYEVSHMCCWLDAQLQQVQDRSGVAVE